MRIITITSIVLLTISQLRAQSFLGQNVPDVTETDCNNNTERIYDVLATGKPILIFKTDMICSNTIGFGTTVRQYADLYQAQYRTWVCADFMDASNYSEQCTFMQQYQQQTGLNANSAFCFIDTTSVGAYDPATRSSIPKCFQGYVVIGLDSTIIYLGNDVNAAVSAALNASQTTGVQQNDGNDYSINLFPNPVTSILQIETDLEIQNIHIYNQVGQLALQSQLKDTKTIDLTALNKGVYFINVENKDGLFSSRKFLKL